MAGTISSYDGLQAALQDYLTGEVINAPQIIIAAFEEEANLVLRVDQMIQKATATIGLPTDIEPGVFPLPTDFEEDLAFQIRSNGLVYTLGDVNSRTEAINSNVYGHSLPSDVTIYNGSCEFSPVPTQPINVTLYYYATIPPLSSTNQTNWLLAKWPSLYLYGALKHASPYIRNDDRMPFFNAEVEKAFDRIQVASNRKRYGPNTRVRAATFETGYGARTASGLMV